MSMALLQQIARTGNVNTGGNGAHACKCDDGWDPRHLIRFMQAADGILGYGPQAVEGVVMGEINIPGAVTDKTLNVTISGSSGHWSDDPNLAAFSDDQARFYIIGDELFQLTAWDGDAAGTTVASDVFKMLRSSIVEHTPKVGALYTYDLTGHVQLLGGIPFVAQATAANANGWAAPSFTPHKPTTPFLWDVEKDTLTWKIGTAVATSSTAYHNVLRVRGWAVDKDIMHEVIDFPNAERDAFLGAMLARFGTAGLNTIVGHYADVYGVDHKQVQAALSRG